MVVCYNDVGRARRRNNRSNERSLSSYKQFAQKLLCKYDKRYLQDEDFVSYVMEALMIGMETYDETKCQPNGCLPGWLCKVGHNAIRTILRRKKHEKKLYKFNDNQYYLPPDDIIVQLETREKQLADLRELILKAGLSNNEIICLNSVLDGKTVMETAKVLNTSYSYARKAYTKGVKKINAYLSNKSCDTDN